MRRESITGRAHLPSESSVPSATASQLPPSFPPLSRSRRRSTVETHLPQGGEEIPRRLPSPRLYSQPETSPPAVPLPSARPVPSPSAYPRTTPPPRVRTPRWRGRLITGLAVLLVMLIAWPAFLYWEASRNIGRADAVVNEDLTDGQTWLLAGSDSRADGAVADDTEGQRADSVILVNTAPNGQTTMISLPRDTYVDIPEYGWNKLNAAFALGGPELLTRTVENLTGLTVDHYVEIGMAGVGELVDAVGGVDLCYDADVEDERSGMSWTAGCHLCDGPTALAFARMRYADPLGDIGRAERQRQVVSKTVGKALSPSTLLNPVTALSLERAGAHALTIDREDSVIDVARLALAFRTARDDGMTGVPPIASFDEPTDVGSVVLLVDDTAPDFFTSLREGTLTADDLVPQL